VSAKPRDQLHFDLLASTKLVKERTTFAPALTTVAVWLGEGFALSALTALVSESTEDLMALVSFGKSLSAWLTTVLASALTFVNAASRALIPLLGLKLVTSLIEFSRPAGPTAVDRPAPPTGPAYALTLETGS
jgi:hypothetical protein